MEYPVLAFDCIGVTEGGRFPAEYTGRGADRTPEFVLHDLSPKAKTLAVTLEDLSHPIKEFTHWVIWDIPAAPCIPGGIPAGKYVPSLGGARQGLGYGVHRYAGPKPPRGRTHRYRFQLYALDCILGLGPHATKRAFLRRAEGHILQRGSVTGIFE
ncbi:MAG: YbhB/YbcL family Raf kinase inhibitor-like protein [Oscillospiraceae bacterium]|nr:YbhB/YbcL family Raf kinase inhibitor-like protein [Oscillospiraceae bacterium]